MLGGMVETNPDAFFDQIVLVAFELCQKAVCFHLIRGFLGLEPCLVEVCLGFVWRGDAKTLDSFPVPLGVFSSFRFGDGCFQRFDAQGNGATADKKESVESCPAWRENGESGT